MNYVLLWLNYPPWCFVVSISLVKGWRLSAFRFAQAHGGLFSFPPFFEPLPTRFVVSFKVCFAQAHGFRAAAHPIRG